MNGTNGDLKTLNGTKNGTSGCLHEASDLHENLAKVAACPDEECIFKKVRNKDGSLKLRNPHLDDQEEDYLYHIALGKGVHDLEEMFGDVKVCS